MEKFEAAKLFLRMFREFPTDFSVKSDTTGRDACYSIQHIKTGTRVNLSVSGKVTSYVVDSEVDLNFVDSDTASAIESFAREILEKQREQSLIAKDNNLVYNITALYA